MAGKIIHMHEWVAPERLKALVAKKAPEDRPFRINWDTLRYHLPSCRYAVTSCCDASMGTVYIASAKPCGVCKPPHHGRKTRQG